MSVGLIINGKSNRTASVADELQRVAGRFNDVTTDVLDGIRGLGDMMNALNRKKVDTVILAGGDGTMQAAFTDAINNNRFDHTPHYVALPCGMTNVIAYDCGLRGEPVQSLEQFLQRRNKGETKPLDRPLLSVGAEGEAPTHGFFLGAGGFNSAVVYGRDRVQSKGAKRSVALVATIAGFMTKIIRAPHDTIDPVDLEIIDGGADSTVPEGSSERTVFLSTTLTSLGAGVYPFWGQGRGGIVSTMVDFPARKILSAVPHILRGKDRPWFEAAGYRSWRADEMTVGFDDPYVFDGETFYAEKNRPLRLDARHKINFLT